MIISKTSKPSIWKMRETNVPRSIVLYFAKRGDSWLLAIIFEPFGITFYNQTDNSVIDIENETEIWAEEMESDFECEFEEGYDGALLDLDVQTIDGKSTFHIRNALI
jgi:hypothetical protein